MSEEEWLTCPGPEKLLRLLRGRAGKRRRRLFGCACCRRIWGLIPDQRSQSAVLAAERYADGLAGEAELDAARAEARAAVGGSAKDPPFVAYYATAACACCVSRDAGDAAKAWVAAVSALQMQGMVEAGEPVPAFTAHPVMQRVWDAERALQADLLRDVFGNPFRPVAISPAWRTPDVVALAQAAYEERTLPSGQLDPQSLQVLADALEDAGCRSAGVLSHLRGPGVHVRGCFVVDLLTGREP